MTIQIDVANAFNSTNRGLTLDVLNGRASRDYACGLKKGDVIPTCDSLSNLFGYFKAIPDAQYIPRDRQGGVKKKRKSPKNIFESWLSLYQHADPERDG